jgi:hypothetical protein
MLIVGEIVTDLSLSLFAFFVSPPAFGSGNGRHDLGRPRLNPARIVEVRQIATRRGLRQMHVWFFGRFAHACQDNWLTRKDQTEANDETDCAPNRRNVSDTRRISRTARNRYQIGNTRKAAK